MTVVLTLVQTKQIRYKIYIHETIQKTVQTIENTVNTSTHITKTPTQLSKHPHILVHTLHITKQVKTTTVQDTFPNKIVTIQSSILSIRSP